MIAVMWKREIWCQGEGGVDGGVLKTGKPQATLNAGKKGESSVRDRLKMIERDNRQNKFPR